VVSSLVELVWAWDLRAFNFIQSGFFALSNFGKVSIRVSTDAVIDTQELQST
jgi:hypothetical protein